MERLVSASLGSSILLVLLILVSCGTARKIGTSPGKDFTRDHPGFATLVESKINQLYREKALFGDFMLAVVDQGGLVHFQAVNRELLEGKASTLDKDSPIYVASHTKSFTGTLLKILEGKNRIDLQRSLYDYLPQLDFQGQVDTGKINIEDLLDHTHGIFSMIVAWKTAYLGYSGEMGELIGDLNRQFQYDPSGTFRYSNLGPILAAMALENHLGVPWKSALEEHIFKPLDMGHSSARASDFVPREIRPSIRANTQEGLLQKGFPKTNVTMHASGGIISTVDDLAKWLSANIRKDPRLLDRDAWTSLHSSHTVQDRKYFTYQRKGYSLGWDVATYQGESLLTRFGNLGGISFHISFMPEKKIGIIAFSNDNRAYLLPHLMANYAYNLIADLPADQIFDTEKPLFEQGFGDEDEIPYPRIAQILEKKEANDHILGVYHNGENWPDIEISGENGQYTMRWGVLQGPIYKGKKGYTATLGALDREFEIKGDSLLTGSLTYHRDPG